MTDEDLQQSIQQLSDEVRSVLGTVEQIRDRQHVSDKRIEELHKDHLQLKDRVQSISSEMRLLEQAAMMNKKSADETQEKMSKSITDLSQKLDKITMGLFISAITIIGGLSVLLYQTLVAGVQT